jgi:arabinogalactan endo-1,4-beta-galactosidase
MNRFTSKELYMMNGGQKLYIYKDGFGDIYEATVAEEEAWKQEYIADTLVQIDNETNNVVLSFAIEGLRFHKYPALNALLLSKINDVNCSPERKVVFETALKTGIE